MSPWLPGWTFWAHGELICPVGSCRTQAESGCGARVPWGGEGCCPSAPTATSWPGVDPAHLCIQAQVSSLRHLLYLKLYQIPR